MIPIAPNKQKKEVNSEGRKDKVDQSSIPMLISEKFISTINDIIEYGEFHTGDSGFFTCEVYPWIENICIYF